MTTKPTREQRLEACLNFFASVIKSGEPWSATCEVQYSIARARDPEPDTIVGPDDHLLEPSPRDREIAALRHEISWLRDVHKHTIDQLAARYELVPPAPVFIPDPQPRMSDTVPVPRERLAQLLAIEKIAKAIVDPETRQNDNSRGRGVTYVADSQFHCLADAVLNVPKDQP